ncbi:hypothetical protein KSS87_022681, partial [Heliosperma pusillum]
VRFNATHFGGHQIAYKHWKAYCTKVARAAKLQEAFKIIGVDLNLNKEDLGKKFGVTDFVNPKHCEENTFTDVIEELTDGGTNYTFECISLAFVMQYAFDSAGECQFYYVKLEEY